jgi:hypothetical protein
MNERERWNAHDVARVNIAVGELSPFLLGHLALLPRGCALKLANPARLLPRNE